MEQERNECNPSENSMLTVSSDVDDSNMLRQCLVGKFCGGDAPIRNEVHRWAQQMWKGAHNIQVYNMNGFLFLFELQTRRMLEHVIMGEWKRQGVIPDEKRFDWFWIRVLGLPLQLWNKGRTLPFRVLGVSDPIMSFKDWASRGLMRHVRWMKFRISTAKFSILINGTPIGFFSSQKGPRQGDQLSPFLFIIAMESLNDMLKIAQENSWFKGFKASHREGSNLEITHLQYVDDTLIFCEAK
ncbi:hypothetical protein MTR67_052629 [Solanum verrucosum]|uniref:Reverse transcriptase domain-containing protein n=1 Tax=Solanum verrucosum TaxID=315347 RepID=A0AAF0V8A5_SOLVR|nr:hypothetical protein MTR67_052629 [Solanum verrucosum]